MLALLVQVVHVSIYAFMALAPVGALLLQTEWVCLIHVACALSILIHWWVNDDACVLTELECKLTKREKKDSVTHQLLLPLLGGEGWLLPLLAAWTVVSAVVAAQWWRR